jgi:AcrR family transcriptional regulator
MNKSLIASNSARKPITDSDARIARTRTEVLSAARQLHREFGADAVTHVRVAELSGVGRTTIYRHWPDTASLLIDALTSPESSAIDLVGGSPRAQVISIVTYVAGRLRSDAAPALLTFMERSETDERYRERLSTFMGSSVDLLKAALRTGGMTEVQADIGALQLIGALFTCRFLITQEVSAVKIELLVDAVLPERTARP